VGDDHHVTVRVLPIEATGDVGHPFREIGEGLDTEIQDFGMLEIRLELSWKLCSDIRPGVAPPSIDRVPFGEIRIDSDRDSGPGGDLLCRPERAFQGGRPDRYHGPRTKISPYLARLLDPERRKTEVGEGSVNDVPRVRDFTVSYQMNKC